MSKATTFANDVLDEYLDNGATGTKTIGATTYTLPVRLRFLSTVATAGASGTEWATAGGYVQGGVSLAGAFSTAAAAAAKANTAAVSVTNAPAGTWADNEIVDSSATPKRMVFRGGASLAKTVNAGDSCIVPVGSLTAQES